jgi:hypothetical protein
VVKNWKVRLFVLEIGSDAIYYYKDEQVSDYFQEIGQFFPSL